MNGLTQKEVNERIDNGLYNKENLTKTKSIKKIIFTNIFTLFNFLNLFLAFLILLFDSFKNLLFMGIVLCNVLISIFQQIRSKKIIDKLSVISSSKAFVIRDGEKREVDIKDIVLDDLIIYKSGNQVVNDAVIVSGIVEVNESFLTGETDLVTYQKGDVIKSGSFVVVGDCKAKVIHVGSDNYVQMIGNSKYIKKINSLLINSLNKIIKLVSIVIIPLGILLFINQYQINQNINYAVVHTVAALIGMIPEGLVLLTTTVLAVSVIRLARLNVLVQELYCIEMLARVDVICLDKTGTITTGEMEVEKVIPLDNYDIDEVMGNIVNTLDDENATFKALKKYFKKRDNYQVIKKIPFSPIKKYSGVEFSNGLFLIGAPEFLCNEKIKEVLDNQNNRVLMIYKDKPIGVIVLKDKIRKNALKTLSYFKEQGVDIKIISGDNIKTISNVASSVGLKDIKCVDVSKIDDLEECVLNNNVFARVSPLQKKQIIEILQKNNHFVAMTGDGVNDVLALKQADCSITIKNASDAARSVSQLVLLNDDFSALPYVVNEGRRSINNIKRSATLFLTKTSYAFLLCLSFIILNLDYPFIPIQLSLTNLFTIGIPSFILALEPNNERITNDFLVSIFKKSIPIALIIVIDILIISLVGDYLNFDYNQISTMCVIMNGFMGFLLLLKICLPLNKLRIALLSSLIVCFFIFVFILKDFYSLATINFTMFIFLAILVAISIILFKIFNELGGKI